MSSVDVWTLLMRSVFESHSNTSSRQGHPVSALVQCAIIIIIIIITDPEGMAHGVGTQQPRAGVEPTTSRSAKSGTVPLGHRVPRQQLASKG